MSVGSLNLGITYSLYLFFMVALDLHFILANALAFAVWNRFGFELQRRFVFRAKSRPSLYSQYLLAQLGFMFVSSVLLWGVVEILGVFPEVGYFFAMSLTTLARYFTSKRLFFVSRESK